MIITKFPHLIDRFFGQIFIICSVSLARSDSQIYQTDAMLDGQIGHPDTVHTIEAKGVFHFVYIKRDFIVK